MAKHRLIPGTAGTFSVRFNDANDAIAFQRGNIVPFFELNEAKIPTGKMLLRDSQDIGSPVINNTIFSDFINDTTGVAFATLAELILFCKTYVFTAGNTPGANVKVWKIKNAPAGINEKPTGASLQDDLYKTDNVSVMVIVTDLYSNGVNLSQNKATGTITTDGNVATFQDGNIVIVISTAP